MREKILRLPVQESRIFNIQLAGITYPDSSYYVKREKTDLWVFEAVLAGRGTIVIDQERFSVQAGDVYILPAWHRHEYFSDAACPFEKIWFNLSGSLVDSLVEIYGLAGHWHLPGAGMKEEFMRFYRVIGREGIRVLDILNEGADEFHRLIRALAGRLPDAPKESPGKALVLKRYIDEHIEKKITTEELANLIFHSSSQMVRIFRTAYGCTPSAYILEKKMERACILLTQSSLLVREIAQKLRFSDEHYFSAVFRKRRGMTPREYRKTH